MSAASRAREATANAYRRMGLIPHRAPANRKHPMHKPGWCPKSMRGILLARPVRGWGQVTLAEYFGMEVVPPAPRKGPRCVKCGHREGAHKKRCKGRPKGIEQFCACRAFKLPKGV